MDAHERAARWPEARAAFEQLLALDADARAAALAALAARDAALGAWVQDLLAADAACEARQPRPERSEQREQREQPEQPEQFGAYEIVERIGRGGMGEVFRARRSDGAFEREVALKRLAPGAASEALVQRFLRERQTLARLDHAHIARLLDGGRSERGEPYLVMELAQGERADVYARQVPLRARLTLFFLICRAVAHAHERGVVHRDLKPANIVVLPDGTPRLLDFGIARSQPVGPAEPALTQTGERCYTPDYASPEQVRGAATGPATDVYALGVLLYEFISGERPFDGADGTFELERRILEADPQPPSRVRPSAADRRLLRDLDAVALRCLQKRPEARYAAALELADDVERSLAGLPVRARRTGPLERLGRWVRRRPVHTLAAVAFAAAGAGFAAHQTSERAAERRAVALREAVRDQIERAVQRGVDGDLRGADEALDAALRSLGALPEDLPLRAEALSRKAVFASFRGDFAAAVALVDGALALGEARLEEPLVARLLNVRAAALQQQAPGPASQLAVERALEYTLQHLPRGDVLRVDAWIGKATELRRLDRGDEALAALAEAVAEARASADPQRRVLARALNDEAVALSRAGLLADSALRYREALEILAWNHGERHPAVAKVRHNLGALLVRAGEHAAAWEPLERALAASREAALPELEASCQVQLVRAARALGRPAEAAAAARGALRLREALPAGARSTCDALAGLALHAAGAAAEALPVLRRALEGAAGEALAQELADEVRGVLQAAPGDPILFGR